MLVDLCSVFYEKALVVFNSVNKLSLLHVLMKLNVFCVIRMKIRCKRPTKWRRNTKENSDDLNS